MDVVLDEPHAQDDPIAVDSLTFHVEPRVRMYLERYGCSIDSFSSGHYRGLWVALRYGAGC